MFDFRLIKISLNIVVVNIMMVFYVIDDEIYIGFSIEFLWSLNYELF